MPIPVPTPPAPQPISDGRFPHGEVITVVERVASGRDDEGNTVWSEVSTDYVGAFSPAVGFESTSLQDQVSSQPQAFLPYAAVVDSYSKLLIRGAWFEVDGTPQYWANPHTGDKPGCVVPLKRVTG